MVKVVYGLIKGYSLEFLKDRVREEVRLGARSKKEIAERLGFGENYFNVVSHRYKLECPKASAGGRFVADSDLRLRLRESGMSLVEIGKRVMRHDGRVGVSSQTISRYFKRRGF